LIRGHAGHAHAGVIFEAAAQMCSFFVQKYDLLAPRWSAWRLEDVRFRDPVRPGRRLTGRELTKRKGRMIVCRFQGVVNGSIVVEGELKEFPACRRHRPNRAILTQPKSPDFGSCEISPELWRVRLRHAPSRPSQLDPASTCEFLPRVARPAPPFEPPMFFGPPCSKSSLAAARGCLPGRRRSA
jgi:hypothetical protein